MESPFRIDMPQNQNEFAARDQLLASTMRETPLRWSYADEYPLVLSPQADAARTSFCMFQGDVIVAHINIWIRQWTHASTHQHQPIALVGNVASHPAHRGHGYIRQLLAHAAEVAVLHGANAIILWSDLLEFYQNLGFTSNGQEVRYQLCRSDRLTKTDIHKVAVQNLTDDDLQAMLDRRPKFEWNLNRSVQEFRSLLTIPDCHIFLRRRGSRLISWFVIGKGSDMAGVVHEWGATGAEELLADIQSLLHEYELPELTLLAPIALQGHWHKAFEQRASSTTKHSMALAKALNPSGEKTLTHLAKGFIWGLDSI